MSCVAQDTAKSRFGPHEPPKMLVLFWIVFWPILDCFGPFSPGPRGQWSHFELLLPSEMRYEPQRQCHTLDGSQIVQRRCDWLAPSLRYIPPAISRFTLRHGCHVGYSRAGTSPCHWVGEESPTPVPHLPPASIPNAKGLSYPTACIG